MTKPVITTRATKGSALTWTEGDTNLENLRDATITVKADTGGTDVVSDLNGTVTLVAGTNVTITGDNTAKTVTINSTASGGATTLDGLSDVVITGTPAVASLLTYDINGNWINIGANLVNVGSASGADYAATVALTADNTTNATNYPLFANAATGNLSPRTDTGFTYNPSTGTLTATTFSGAATTVTLTADNTTNATEYPLFSGSATGSVSPRTDTGFTYNPSTGTLTATTFSGALSGNASSATYASAVTLTADDTTAATNYPLFANAATGNLSPRTDTGFTYNPSTGTLTATTFSGALSGNASTATSASSATYASAVTLTADNTTNATNYPLFVNAATGNLSPRTDTGFTYNPSTGTLTAISFSGALNGTVGATTPAVGYFTGTQMKSGGEVSFYNSTNTAYTAIKASASASGNFLTLPPNNGSNGQYLKTDGTGVLSWGTISVGGTVTSIDTAGTVNGLTLTGGPITSTGTITLGGTLNLSSPPAIGGVTPSEGSFTNVNVKSGNYLFLYGNAAFYNAFRTSASQAANVAYTLPTADGSANQVLKTDGAGNLSWTTVSGGGGIALTDLSVGTENTASDDGAISYNNTTGVFTYTPPTASGIGAMVAATPQLGGDLDLVSYKITTTTVNGNILIEPNGTGDVYLRSDRVYVNEPNVDANITTDGTGDLILSTNAGASSGLFRIYDGANGNIVITPNGTGKTQVSAINYNEGALYDLGTTGGTIAPNVANGNVQKITLNAALTINAFTSPVAGQSLTLIIYGGTAYTSITSTMKFAGGVKTLTGTAGCIDILSVYYDGTNYFASLGKGFA